MVQNSKPLAGEGEVSGPSRIAPYREKARELAGHFFMFAREIRSIFTNRNRMPSPTAPRAPGYRFKDGKLMIFHEDEVMLIQGGSPDLYTQIGG